MDTKPADGDQLVIRTLHACPSGGRELVGSDFTEIQVNILPPNLAAKKCAMNFATAIEAVMR